MEITSIGFLKEIKELPRYAPNNYLKYEDIKKLVLDMEKVSKKFKFCRKERIKIKYGK